MTREEAFEVWLSRDVRRSEMGSDVDVWRDAFNAGYDVHMTEFTDAINRAINERGEKGITDVTALSALNAMMRQSMRKQWDDWVAKVGEESARELWSEHFGNEPMP